MTTARKAIYQTSDRLVDQEAGYEFTTWTELQLLDAFNFALGVVASRRPSAYASWVDMDLREGSGQEVGPGCEQVLSLGALKGSNGEYLDELTFTRPMNPLVKRLALCGPSSPCDDASLDGDGEYRPVTIEQVGDRGFRVWPPVPAGKDYSMEVLCFKSPSAEHLDSDVHLPNSLRPALLEIMMYYAHMYDIEAVPSRDRAAKHWEAAMTLLGATQ